MAQLVTIKEAARMLGIESRSAKREGNRLWELIHGKRIDLPCVRIGRRFMFDPDEVLRWIKRKQNGRS